MHCLLFLCLGFHPVAHHLLFGAHGLDQAGHTFGLGHSGCSQTMAPSLSACKAGTRVYGKGDVLGLRALY